MDQITVVVPYYNESETIETTLEMLLGQTSPPKHIVLVNSSSTDDSFLKIDRWIESRGKGSGINFLNLSEGTGNPGASKNLGVRNSETPLVAFMDCGLKFPSHWLESHVSLLRANPSVDWVAGIGKFRGTGVIDRCATAQTTGEGTRPHNIPSSVMRRDAFDHVGSFDSRRAGYDVAWRLRAEKKGLDCVINTEVVVEYMKINFSRSIVGVFKKSFVYSSASTGIKGYRAPYQFLSVVVVVSAVAVLRPAIGLALLGLYALLRGFLIPTMKGGGLKWFSEKPWMILPMIMVGSILDISRTLGVIAGIMRELRIQMQSVWARTS